MDEWINKMEHVHLMEYYLNLRRSEILTHVATWTKVMLSEISIPVEEKYCMALLV
jgi:hypothetical protein